MFVLVNVVEVDDFVETADDTFFCDFSICFEIDVVGFPCVVSFVFVEVEDVVVTAGAKAFGVEGHFSFASFAGHAFRLPLEFLVACVAEAFGVMFFFLRAVATFFYHHLQNKSVRTLNTLCKRAISVRFPMEERHTICIMRTFAKNSHNTCILCEFKVNLGLLRRFQQVSELLVVVLGLGSMSIFWKGKIFCAEGA